MSRLTTLSFACLALALGAVTASAEPLVAAYSTSSPPHLDGVLNDACWKAASVCGPFVSAGAPHLGAVTQARICWDQDNIYVAFECFDRYLEPALQQTARVKAQAKRHDGNVFGDDCVEIFFDIPGSGLYHFAANSIGTRWEARNDDPGWNCNWQAVAVRGNDRYTVECAIPLAALGVATLAGQSWQANFCRERKAVVENSTWSGLQGAFNDTSQFGTLRFVNSGPSLLQAKLAALAPTRYRLSGQVLNPQVAPEVTLALDLAVGKKSVAQFTKTAPQAVTPTAVNMDFDLPAAALQAGQFNYSYSLKSANTVLYSSPAIPVALGLTRAVFTLATAPGATCQAFMNGKPLKPGQVDLQEGLNMISLLANGRAGWVKPQITIGDQQLPADSRWFCSTAAPPADWQTATSVKGFAPAATDANGIWSRDKAAGKVYFRRGIWLSAPQPRIFPMSNKVWLPAGSSQLIKTYLIRPGDLPSNPYQLCLQVPSYLRYVAADGQAGTKPQAVKAISRESLHGRSYTTYQVTYSPFPGTGMELSLRWGDANGSLVSYMPAIRAGGTFGWTHFKTVVKAPDAATSLHPLVIKWNNRGITGTFWVDNITIRKLGSKQDLLQVGNFEGPEWHDSRIIAGQGMNGSKGLRIICQPNRVNDQDAMWIPKDSTVKVEPGAQYVVELDARAENLHSTSDNPMAALLFAVDPKAPRGADKLWTYFEADSGNVTEVAQTVGVTVLPPLLDVRPKQIQITPCYYSDTFSNPAVLAAMADNFWRSGMTANYGRADNQLVHLLRQKGHYECTLSLGYTPWQAPPSMPDLLKQHPEARAVEYTGKPSNSRMCPTWALTQGQYVLKALSQDMAKLVANGLYQGADWDVEDPVVRPPSYCFCPRCLAAFRQEAGIAPDVKLTPEIILKDYRTQWTDFRCRQNAELAEYIRRGVKAGCPGITFSVYSGYQTQSTREHYGVDWSMMAPALDLGIAGYNGAREAIQDTIKALGTVPFMGGVMYYLSPTSDSGSAPNPLTWRNRLLRQCLASGGRGVLIWWFPVMDGGAQYYTSEAAAVLARYESLFHDGQRCDSQVTVTGLPVNDWFAYQRNGARLVLLLNFKPDPVTATVTLPAGWQGAAVVDPVSGQPVGPTPAAGPIACTIPAYGVRVITAHQ